MSYRGQTPCPYCGDSAFLHVQKKPDREKGKIGESILPCCCTNASVINKRFPTLMTVSDPPATEFIEITKRFTEIKDNKRVIKNFVFYGPEKRFFYLYKSIMLYHWNSVTSFELIDGIQVVHNYFVGKDEKTLYDLQKYKLLGICFISVANNKAMSTTILDTVKNRLRINAATWLYAQSPEDLRQSQEYSEELGEIVKTFNVCDLNKNFSYPGYGATEENATQKRRNVQINASNL
jgi:hypothetical protein